MGEALLNLSDEAKRARAAYQREWRKKNPDKVREYNRRRWERAAEKLREQEKQEGVDPLSRD